MSIADSIPHRRGGLHGHLRLVAGINEAGRSHLREQSFSAPVHLGKTFLDQDVLLAHIVNPTAGLLDGDTLHVDVRVESGARLLLTNPAATRVHTMKGGRALVQQNFTVAKGAWLEVWPDLFIPQAGARYDQKTRIELEAGGEALFFEILTPGRVASGESFAFDQLDWQTDIFWDGTLIVRERYSLSPATPSLYALQAAFEHSCQMNCFVLSEALPEDHPCWNEINALHDAETWIGCSRLAQGGSVIKMLARDSIAMRACVEKIRPILYTAANWPLAASRKV